MSQLIHREAANVASTIYHRSLLTQLPAMEPRVKNSPLIDGAIQLSPRRWAAKRGVAQGSPFSPLLANVALTEFAHVMQSRHWVLVRCFAWYYHQTDSKRLFWTLDQFVRERLEELEAQLGIPVKPWQDAIVQMSRMREVGWNGSGKKKPKCRRWNGYGG